MSVFHLPTLASFLAFLTLGIYVFLRNRRELVNILFALGMVSLALMEFGDFVALLQMEPEAALLWKRISLVGECLVPVTWLAFSLSFARKERWSKGWKGVVICAGVVSATFAALVPSRLFLAIDGFPGFLALGGIGKAFYVFSLTISVLIVAYLEHTTRQSKGDQRAQIRSLVLGVGGLFVLQIYVASQSLLFSRVNLGMLPVISSAFLICSGLMAFSVVRYRLMDVNLYMSRFVFYNSLTLLVVGGYLIFIGLVSQVIQSLNLLPGYPLEILFLFVALMLFFSLFLSDRVRWKARMLINKHFYRSRYDYRKEWLKFAEGLGSKLDIDDLTTTTVNMLRDLLGVDEISLWLHERDKRDLRPVNPSSLIGKAHLGIDQEFINAVKEKKTPFSTEVSWARDFVLENSEIIERLQPALLVPLVSGKEMVGLILLGKKTTGEEYLGDDIDLLKSAATQIASAIINAELSQELIHAKEMEVFHRFSSFVLHDLKNLVSNLSLVVENAGEHMGNPEFQRDAFDTVGRSVKKMEGLIARLSNNTGDLRLNLQKSNLNEIVSGAVGRMEQNGLKNKAVVQTDLGRIPLVLADREQIEKVIVNLLLNAFEALDDGGLITVRTEANKDKVILSVSDNGPGMSSEFVENALFKPFKSTKKKGLGIGLYQCKSIVEAHEGRISVESSKGAGSTFRIFLPGLRQTADGRPMTVDLKKTVDS